MLASPMAFIGIGSMVIYVTSPILARMFPKNIPHVSFDLWSLLGIGLTILGVFVIVLRQGAPNA
jgi:hypothetical protein